MREVQLHGGPAHGKRFAVTGAPLHVRIPVMEPVPLALPSAWPSDPVKPLPIKTAIYRAVSDGGDCCNYEFIGMDGEELSPRAPAGHVNRFGIRINTPPELILRRIDDEFEDALLRTSAAQDAMRRASKWWDHRYRCCYMWINDEGHVHVVKTPQARNFHEAWDWLCGQWDGWVRQCNDGYADGKLIRISYVEKIKP
jgi:hypothetical protein